MTILVLASLAVVLVVALAGQVVFVEFPRSAVERTRDELFCIRDRLFKVASDGKVSFDHRGYRTARELINGMIRYAHDVSVTHLIFANLFANREARHLRRMTQQSIQNELRSLPKSARDDVTGLLEEASAALTRLVVFRSVSLSMVFCVYVAFSKAKQLLNAFRVRRQSAGPVVTSDVRVPKMKQLDNAQESMRGAIEHGPMRKLPRLVVREAGRYAIKSAWGAMPAAA